MIALAVVFVAVGLGVASAGIYASRSIVATANAAALEVGEPAVVHGGVVHRALEPLLDQAARLMRALSPAARLDLIGRRIVYAGLESRVTVENILVRKAIAAVAGAGLGVLVHPHRIPVLLAAPVLAVLASFVPDVLLDSKARSRQTQIARALPDALDLLAITVEAGLGLEQALSVVTERLDGPLGDELRRMLAEIELGVDRRQALELLRSRTDVRELSAFVIALLQADELGMSVGDVLRVQAGQVRLLRRQRAREQAAKTPVKILFPVVLGIFPAMFVVTIGPGAVTIVRSLFSH
ncbi:MAG: type II secretion system F family protein [Frankiales bacterium]|nr:type II secretion system F family protein [Frankiales bacterium]